MSYEEKIYAILENKLENNGDNERAVEDVKTWLRCEWQCDMIKETGEYIRLLGVVDVIAEQIIKEF